MLQRRAARRRPRSLRRRVGGTRRLMAALERAYVRPFAPTSENGQHRGDRGDMPALCADSLRGPQPRAVDHRDARDVGCGDGARAPSSRGGRRAAVDRRGAQPGNARADARACARGADRARADPRRLLRRMGAALAHDERAGIPRLHPRWRRLPRRDRGLVSNTTNRFTGTRFGAPALVQLESNVLDWFRDWMQFPETTRGIFTTGGSMANFNAILCARERHLGAELRGGVLYTSRRRITRSRSPRASPASCRIAYGRFR